MTPDSETVDTDAQTSRHASARGKFEIYHAPEITHLPMPDEVTDADLFATPDTVDYSSLLEHHEEGAIRDAVDGMVRALVPGLGATPLFYQLHPEGMSLVRAWFAPNLQMFRHSHPVAGDCLYYVLAGELIMGNQVLKPGDGFFVPNGMPYKFKAGPDGLEVLEFRAGGGIEGAPGLKLDESSLSTIEAITETAKENHDLWASQPSAVVTASR